MKAYEYKITIDALNTSFTGIIKQSQSTTSGPAGTAASELGGATSSGPRSSAPSQALPPNFPWRDTSADFGKTADGLPPARKEKGQSEAWLSVYETNLPMPSSYHELVRPSEEK